MVGLLLLGLTLLTGCAQLAEIEADPHFWPGARHRLRRVPASTGPETPYVKPIKFDKAPSMSRSEWHLLGKESYAKREYKLIVRDEHGKLMDNTVAPDMILDGDVVLHRVKKLSEATWSVALEFTKDQSIVKVGFSQGGQRVSNFRQMHFNLHEMDPFATHAYAFKTKVRADGKDNLRVYVSLKDIKGYTIYSHEDFDMKLTINSKLAKVEGPFSTSTGPYFRITSLRPTKLDYHLVVDGVRVSGDGHVQFIDMSKRGPAAEVRDCLADMAIISGTAVPTTLEPREAYKELAQAILRRFEETRDITPDSVERTLGVFSTPSCTANGIWDVARDDAGRALRIIHQRLGR